jgi:hypothetical protein
VPPLVDAEAVEHEDQLLVRDVGVDLGDALDAFLGNDAAGEDEKTRCDPGRLRARPLLPDGGADPAGKGPGEGWRLGRFSIGQADVSVPGADSPGARGAARRHAIVAGVR